MRLNIVFVLALILCDAGWATAQNPGGCEATDRSTEPIVVRGVPRADANVIQSITKYQASTLIRRDALTERHGDWLEVHIDGSDGWVSAKDVVCRLRPEEARDTIAKEASQVIEALKARDVANLAEFVHPVKGLRFSPIATVDPKRDVVLTASQLKRAFRDPMVRVWGRDDGSGAPIRLSFARYFRTFIYNRDYALASKITYDGGDEGTAKAWGQYPNAIISDYYLPETDKFPEEHLRLVFEQHKGRWYLSGVIHDGWTV